MEKPSEIAELLISELRSEEYTMDIEGFLLASGFATMLVLLGWASQITSRSKETKDLEASFLEKAKLKRDDYKKMITEGGATEDSFTALVDFLYSSEEDNVVIFEKIKRIREDLQTLDNNYNSRFWILLLMSISLFMSGTVVIFLCPADEFWALVPNLIFVIIVFYNLVKVHNLEKRYNRNISEAMEKF